MVRLLTVFLLVVSAAPADEASRLYKEARRAEKRGDDLKAYSFMIRAAGAGPKNPKYKVEAERLRVRASQALTAMNGLQEALALDSGNGYLRAKAGTGENEETFDPPSPAELREAEKAAGPVTLKPAPGRRSFDLRGDARAVYEHVARAYGLKVVFDPDFTPGPLFRFRIDDAGFHEAFHALMSVTGTFMAPVNEQTFLVANDTQQKRSEAEPMASVLLPIPEAVTTEETNEIARAVQQTLEIKRLAIDTARRQVLVRDTAAKVNLARMLFADLARKRAEVMIDVDLISVSHSSLTNFGLTLPASAAAVPGRPGQLNVGGGQTLFGIAVANPNFEADLTLSNAQLLESFRVRATDGLAANMHIGQHYPIINASFSPIAITQQIRSLQNSGQLIQPFPSFTFEDLGLLFKVTPRVHDSREVSLSLEAEFKDLTGQSFNQIPVIAERKFACSVRMQEGQTSIVSGLAQIQSSRSQSGPLGLSRIPILGRLLRRRSFQVDQQDVLILLTPRIVSLPPAEQFPRHAFYTGTESRPESPL
jgi:general secretion pathway protein D